MGINHKYYYNGPVLYFGVCIAQNWQGETVAPSEKRARSNLTYRFKKEAGRIASANINLPGKLELVE